MKAFDLEKALAGEPVVTRNGQKVTEIHLFRTINNSMNLIAVIDGNMCTYTADGRYTAIPQHDYDLFMESQIILCWVNVYEKNNEILFGANFSTLDLALTSIDTSDGSIYIKTIKVTNEND